MSSCDVAQVSRSNEADPLVEIMGEDAGDPVALSEVDHYQLAQQCAVGESEYEGPTGEKNPTGLGHHGVGILHMLEHLGANNRVEAFICEREVLSSGECKRQANVLRCVTHRGHCRIDADHHIPSVR
jgi:hypothetical protein